MDLYQKIFDSSYSSTLEMLRKQYESGKISTDQIKAELEALYKYEGMDWTGRGEVKRGEIEGKILAYTAFLNRRESGEG